MRQRLLVWVCVAWVGALPARAQSPPPTDVQVEPAVRAVPDHPAALCNLCGTYDASADTGRTVSQLHVASVPHATGPGPDSQPARRTTAARG